MHNDAHIERFISINEGDPYSTITSVVDWRLGLIRVVSPGFWSVRQAEEHLRDFTGWVARMHEAGLAASVIIDVRGAPAQSQEISEVLRSSLQDIFCAGDRCAIVVSQSIAKMQMRRVLPTGDYTFFTSLPAAETWAMADKYHLPGSCDAAHLRDGRP